MDSETSQLIQTATSIAEAGFGAFCGLGVHFVSSDSRRRPKSATRKPLEFGRHDSPWPSKGHFLKILLVVP